MGRGWVSRAGPLRTRQDPQVPGQRLKMQLDLDMRRPVREASRPQEACMG